MSAICSYGDGVSQIGAEPLDTHETEADYCHTLELPHSRMILFILLLLFLLRSQFFLIMTMPMIVSVSTSMVVHIVPLLANAIEPLESVVVRAPDK